MTQPLGDSVPTGIGDWSRQVFDDEVLFWPKHYKEPYVSEVPFVSGFFVVDVPFGYGSTTRILAGPFKTLKTAIASIALTS